jgi:DNA-binding CsgD family transcriptional regulator
MPLEMPLVTTLCVVTHPGRSASRYPRRTDIENSLSIRLTPERLFYIMICGGMMSLLADLLEKFKRTRRTFQVDADLVSLVEELAERQRLPADEVASDLLQSALAQAYSAEAVWRRWESLSSREKQAAALNCLGYTNRQMAARLHVSVDTIKTHVHNALVKFGLHSKAELRLVLADWDFSDWEKPEPQVPGGIPPKNPRHPQG